MVPLVSSIESEMVWNGIIYHFVTKKHWPWIILLWGCQKTSMKDGEAIGHNWWNIVKHVQSCEHQWNKINKENKYITKFYIFKEEMGGTFVDEAQAAFFMTPIL